MAIPHEIKCSTIKDFWLALSPVGGVYDGYVLPVFRGQGDASWRLTPGALRENFHEIYSQPLLGKNQLSVEYFSLSVFNRFCNDAGLHMPAGIEQFHDPKDENDEGVFPPWEYWKDGA
ncbi:hypothetical protein [Vogesella indigofera]|uniref:Uncharacterized protein n=1 Tax=Vogesella indigofera TaxID=45465 RepID=A0ABT5I6Q7_VOGIN|nr:hypothetical protein [Vogesella indigofera]MDC7691863.1 hypothetical protein [Vogesella indigofera]